MLRWVVVAAFLNAALLNAAKDLLFVANTRGCGSELLHA